MNPLPLKLDIVSFQNAPGELGALWHNLCTAENELATRLHAFPLGTALVLRTDAWFLKDEDQHLVLCHANYIDGRLSEVTSRFDFSLEWVDVEVDALDYYIDLVGEATQSFNPIDLSSKIAQLVTPF